MLITEAEPIEEPGPRIVYANQAFTRMTGYSLEEMLGKTPRIVQGPNTERATLDKIRAALKVWQPVTVELLNYRKDGSEFWVEISIVPVANESGWYTHWVSIQRDITERKAAEALRQSEERYALAVRGANDGLWDWNLIANKVYFSSRWKSMLGYFENEIGNSPNDWFNRVHPEDTERVRAAITAHLEGLMPHFENEHRMLSKDGTYRWMLSRGTAIRDINGNAYRIVGSQTDITDRRVAEEQLLHNAFHDALTGLPNRTLFIDRLKRAIERAKRHEDYLFAVLFLDLDRFKVVNDSLGHLIGNQLLSAIARRLEACLRPTDTAARFGGDEFTILLEDIQDVNGISHVAERIQEELKLPFELLCGQEVIITASIGIALSASGYDQPEDLLRDADIAMYRAKALGKARYEIFNPDLHDQAVARLQLETALRRAIERQEFRIYYQPIVSLETGCITGFEALVRWQHPMRGLLPPAEFIPIATETGLSISMDWWVLAQACRQTRIWQEQFPDNLPLTISVNLCSQHFSQPNLINHIDQILQETGLDAHSLKLEITENLIMDNADATTTLEKLRTLGIQLSIDDFGTGYSSLGRLHHFPINVLKIDRSFVSRIGVEQGNLEITETIVALAQKLGLDVTAEGVETAEQLAQLRELKCEYGQGHFFSRPLVTEAVEALLAVKPQW